MELAFAFEGRLGGLDYLLRGALDLGGITGVVGPSGAGKSTLLRLLAGFERAGEGWCRLGGEVLEAPDRFVRPERRGVAYVAQDAPLFPHLSVARHLEFGLRRRPRRARRFHAEDVVASFGLGHLLGRGTDGLSGGERQRVALATAVLASPRLLLLDEPVSALDPAAREGVLSDLERIARDLELPLLFVSHAMAEVARLADRVLVLGEGRIRRQGAVCDLLNEPELSEHLGEEVGAVLEAEAVGEERGLVEARVGELSFFVAARNGGRGACAAEGAHAAPEARRGGWSGAAGGPGAPSGRRSPLRLRIRARDVSLAREREGAGSILNVLPARVLELRSAGAAEVLVTLALGESDAAPRIFARITRRSREDLGIEVGTRLHARVKAASLGS